MALECSLQTSLLRVIYNGGSERVSRPGAVAPSWRYVGHGDMSPPDGDPSPLACVRPVQERVPWLRSQCVSSCLGTEPKGGVGTAVCVIFSTLNHH